MIETSELQKVNHSIIKPFRLLPLVKSQTIPKSLGLNLFNSSNMKDILTTEDRTRFNSNCEKKIKELEKSLEFMKDQNQILIKYLFHEIDVLKKKNRGKSCSLKLKLFN